MTNENDNVNNPGTDNNEEPKHHTWLGDIVDKIQKLDTEFPLSGGETNEDLDDVLSEEEETEEPTSFPKDINTQFPLSGGETEERL